MLRLSPAIIQLGDFVLDWMDEFWEQQGFPDCAYPFQTIEDKVDLYRRVLSLWQGHNYSTSQPPVPYVIELYRELLSELCVGCSTMSRQRVNQGALGVLGFSVANVVMYSRRASRLPVSCVLCMCICVVGTCSAIPLTRQDEHAAYNIMEHPGTEMEGVLDALANINIMFHYFTVAVRYYGKTTDFKKTLGPVQAKGSHTFRNMELTISQVLGNVFDNENARKKVDSRFGGQYDIPLYAPSLVVPPVVLRVTPSPATCCPDVIVTASTPVMQRSRYAWLQTTSVWQIHAEHAC